MVNEFNLELECLGLNSGSIPYQLGDRGSSLMVLSLRVFIFKMGTIMIPAS